LTEVEAAKHTRATADVDTAFFSTIIGVFLHAAVN